MRGRSGVTACWVSAVVPSRNWSGPADGGREEMRVTDGERCMPAAGDDGFEVEAGAGAGAGSGAAAPPVGTGRGLETVETDAGAGEGAGAAMGAAEGAAGSLAGEGAGPGAGSIFDGLSLKLKAAT